ncbi:Gfo/Idh/MocA family protein [Aquimarina sp. AU474]|uniref:Gfo/Idh/MocA family protein n=1 Tax=Aquimarina sp. AU474 TaxID=2108529 RepID=UPI000D697088|nr:Gfo/Idh/MocA family oxidoreductase [Aquimarina sp. AU474]
MNLNKNVNWGILGCGKIAHKFAEDLLTVPNATLYAVASRTEKKAQDFGNSYGVTNNYGSYNQLTKDPNIDVIYIATPHVFHYENTLLCLNHKKAVLCEKPFAMNQEQVEEMIQTAIKNNVFLMEALWTYFLPHYKYVLDLIASKKFGAVKSLQADFGFAATFSPNERLFNKALGGGSLLDVGIYPLFAALSIIGYPEHITAKASFGKTQVDETCTVDLLYKNEVNASLHCAITKKTKTEAIIELENGTIHINSRFHEPSSITIITENESKLIEFEVKTNGYSYEAIHVQEMILKNRTESTIMTFEKSRQLIKLLDTVRAKIGLSYT